MAVPRVLQGGKGSIRLTDQQPRKGGQAEVHHGVNAEGQPVAVKIALEGEDERRGLRAERDALSSIQRRQPGSARWLVKILDQGELPDGRPFLVLPWYEHSLQSWMRLRQPALMQRLEALERASEAVVQLHRSAASLAGVVLHRDLKPGNLLVEERAEGLRVVLADLGGVKERKLHDATRNTGIHTPYFAPLEQMLPIDRQADPSVDVHALAVVIYAVLVGRPPQVVMSRTGLLTHAAEQLILLHQAGGGRNDSDRERYAALRRAPLEQLIELDHAVALPDDDVARLRQGLSNLLSDRGAQADELADALTGMLAPVLRHALEPNPRNRLSRPEVLLAALEAATERLGGRPAVAVVEEVATTAQAPELGQKAERPASSPTSDASSRMWLAGLASVALLTVICAGALGLATWRPWAEEGLSSAAEPERATTTVAPPPDPLPSEMTPADPHARATAAPSGGSTPGGAGTPASAQNGKTGGKKGSEVEEVAGNSTAEAVAPPPDPPPSPEPVSVPDPLVVVFSVEDDLGASATVNGRALGAVLKTELGAGSHTIALRSTIATEPRAFDLIIAQTKTDDWRITIRDPRSAADTSVDRAGGTKVKVRWRRDGSLGFDSAASSDP